LGDGQMVRWKDGQTVAHWVLTSLTPRYMVVIAVSDPRVLGRVPVIELL
jgi:hypothetical protein